MNFAYFGGEPIGLPVLKILHKHGLVPSIVICNPDRQSGRKQLLTPPPIKVWATDHTISVYQPESYKDENIQTWFSEQSWDLFVVVAYNFILPEWLIELPTHKTINVHPSLLPKLRGPSPIRSAILDDTPEYVGTSVMLMETKMDSGPILAQTPYTIAPDKWPIDGQTLDEALAVASGELLASTIPDYVAGTITPTPQDHTAATYTKKLTRTDGLLELDLANLPTGEAAKAALLKIRGLAGWPGTHCFYNDTRLKITAAEIGDSGQLVITEVIPEGKKPQSLTDWLQRT